MREWTRRKRYIGYQPIGGYCEEMFQLNDADMCLNQKARDLLPGRVV
jgi:hypothetical protein